MKISEIEINGQVMTKTGRIGRVTSAHDDGDVYVMFGCNDYPDQLRAGELELVSDPCHDCPKITAVQLKAFWEGKAEGEKAADKRIAELQKECDGWKSAAEAYSSLKDDYRSRLTEARRNAVYWREELSKLQNETLTECEPLAEVAKIYIQISPAVLAHILAGRED